MRGSLLVYLINGMIGLHFSESDNVERLQEWFIDNEQSQYIVITEIDNMYTLKRSNICYMVECAR